MVKAAEQFAAADKNRRERVEAANQAEGVLHDTDTKLDEYKAHLPQDEVGLVHSFFTNGYYFSECE